MTREEFQQTYGYDPTTRIKPATPIAVEDEGGGVIDHLKSGAVGIATVPTDVIALPGLVQSGVAGLYRSYRDDTKFLDEFAKSQRIEGAQQNIQKHLNTIAQTWKQENSALSIDRKSVV